MELSGFKVFHKWTPQEYLDFLKDNGFEITGRKIFDGTLKLTYAEAVRDRDEKLQRNTLWKITGSEWMITLQSGKAELQHNNMGERK